MVFFVSLYFCLCYFLMFQEGGKYTYFFSITKNEPDHFIFVCFWYFPMLQQGDEYTYFSLV